MVGNVNQIISMVHYQQEYRERAQAHEGTLGYLA
jgi:hypothetical protein